MMLFSLFFIQKFGRGVQKKREEDKREKEARNEEGLFDERFCVWCVFVVGMFLSFFFFFFFFFKVRCLFFLMRCVCSRAAFCVFKR